MIHTKSKDNSLEIFTALMTVMFLLMAFQSAYGRFSEGPCEGDKFILVMNTISVFAKKEIPFIIAIYSGGSLLSDAMPHLWAKGKRIWTKLRAHQSVKAYIPEYSSDRPASDISSKVQFQLMDKQTIQQAEVVITDCEPNNYTGIDDDSQAPKSITTELSEELENYVKGTFENILHIEQIEKLLNNCRNINNGGPFEVITKKALPNEIRQIDLWNFAWNLTIRLYDKRICKLKMREAGAIFIKSSFPLTATSHLDTISSKLKYTEDERKFSLPCIEPGNKLIPHNFFGSKKD